MADVEVVLNWDGIREIKNSAEVMALLEDEAEKVKSRAGDTGRNRIEIETNTTKYTGRGAVILRGPNPGKAEADHGYLARGLGAGEAGGGGDE